MDGWINQPKTSIEVKLDKDLQEKKERTNYIK
jgi:hypothetical protein